MSGSYITVCLLSEILTISMWKVHRRVRARLLTSCDRQVTRRETGVEFSGDKDAMRAYNLIYHSLAKLRGYGNMHLSLALIQLGQLTLVPQLGIRSSARVSARKYAPRFPFLSLRSLITAKARRDYCTRSLGHTYAMSPSTRS